ncbi:hypothetical protein [Methylotuvimicrobium sp. KM1]|uniref:hypothetical protein n=1 Tax=Methylotuvimicrobium sp. KM1 TaxID=3377707 RepID=UPI0038514FC3
MVRASFVESANRPDVPALAFGNLEGQRCLSAWRMTEALLHNRRQTTDAPTHIDRLDRQAIVSVQ